MTPYQPFPLNVLTLRYFSQRSKYAFLQHYERKLTWMQNFLSFRVACAEGTVELEVINIVEE